jgi:cell cycle checkpoint protein
MMHNQGRTRRQRRRTDEQESTKIIVLDDAEDDLDFDDDDDHHNEELYCKKSSKVIVKIKCTNDKNLKRLQHQQQKQRRNSHPSIEMKIKPIQILKQAPQSQFLGWPKREPLSLSQHPSPASIGSNASPTKRPRTQYSKSERRNATCSKKQRNLSFEKSPTVSSPTCSFYNIFTTTKSQCSDSADLENVSESRARRVTFEKSQTIKSDSTIRNSPTLDSKPSILNVKDADRGVIDTSGELWCEKFQPTSINDLCIANKKIQEVASWIQSSCHSALSSRNQSNCLYNSSISDNSRGGKLLILVGSPGIGKSTMISCLVKEMNISKMEWVESSYTSSGSSSFGYLTQNQHQRFFLEHHSPIQSFEQFLKRSGPGFHSLQITTNSVNQQPKQQEKQQSIIVLDELPNLHGGDAETNFRNILTNHIIESAIPTILLYSNVTEGKHHPDDFERLIEPSVLYNPTLVHIMTINKPTKIKYKQCIHRILLQIDKIVDPNTISVVGGNQRKKIRKQVQHEKHSFSMSVSDDVIDDWYEQSTGDVRAAINRLQFELSGDCANTARTHHGATAGARSSTINSSPSKSKKNIQRDIKLSSFHALGKLLYAKRQIVPTTNGTTTTTNALLQEQRPPLQFDPEGVIDQCTDMGIDGILQFVQHHSIDFFTDITELSIAMDHFSDAAIFLNPTSAHYRSTNTKNTKFQSAASTLSSNTIFPIGYASSLTSRAVANANRHPTTCTTLRRFTAPGIYEIYRQMYDNQRLYNKKLLRNFASSLITRDVTMSKENNPCVCQVKYSLSDYVVEISPYSRLIRQSTLGGASYHDDDIVEDQENISGNDFEIDDEEIKKFNELQEILKDDDIEDDDDDTTSNDKTKPVDDFIDGDDIDWSIVPNY